MSPKDFRKISHQALFLARTLREAEEGVTLNDKRWHVRRVTGARGTHAGGLGRIATAPDDEVDLGPELGSGLIQEQEQLGLVTTYLLDLGLVVSTKAQMSHHPQNLCHVS